MSLWLILNAVEGRVQTVFLENRNFVCAQEWNAPSQGAELLTPLLADTFARLKRTPMDISHIACVCGPGSFTGIRLVLATASALRRSTGAKVASLNALQVLAAGVPLFPSYRIRVLTHARRDLVHGQDFLRTEQAIPLNQPAIMNLDAVFADPLPDICIGSGVTKNLTFLQKHAPQKTILMPFLYDHASIAALSAVTLALPDSAWLDRDLEAIYLRPCDAVENLSAIATKRGENPDQVQAKLRQFLSQSIKDI